MSADWSLYMIENRLNQLYTGITKDLDRRFQEHSDGGPKGAKALKGKGPLRLVFTTQGLSHSEALKLERLVKRLPSDKKRQMAEGRLSVDSLKQRLFT